MPEFNKAMRRIRLLLALVVLVVLTAVALYFTRDRGSLFENVVADLVAALVIFLVVERLLHGTTGQEERDDKLVERICSRLNGVRPVAPDSISNALASARNGATEYFFQGNTGSHFATVTLPALAKESTRNGNVIAIDAELLDPTDKDACQAYAKLRGIANELAVLGILGTVTALGFYCSTHPKLRCSSFKFRRSFSQFRLDWSDKSAVITTEQAQDPAIVVEGSSHFHRKLRDHRTWRNATPVVQANFITPGLPKSICRLEGAHVQQILLRLNTAIPTGTNVDEIARFVRKRKNPYG